MKGFKEFLNTYDDLEFRQLIENEFNLRQNVLNEQQSNLLIEKICENGIYSKLSKINEDYLLTGNPEEHTKVLLDIKSQIFPLLSDIGVTNSDYDQKKLVVAMEGLDFSKMNLLLKSIEKKINSDKKNK